MAIAPLSDIVLDVAGAADPAKRREATERLAKLAGNPAVTGPAFSDLLGSHVASPPAASANPTRFTPNNTHFGLAQNQAPQANKVYEKFEAVFLQNFVDSILPKDDDYFGDPASAGIYRSMLAEQLSQQIAKNGKLGIASKILAAHPPGSGHHTLAMPIALPASNEPALPGPDASLVLKNKNLST